MTFEDLKGCLILLSYDTVRPEDESQTWHNVLPYTFEDGCLPIFVAWPLTIRAEERPWINGGALSGLGMGILFFLLP